MLIKDRIHKSLDEIIPLDVLGNPARNLKGMVKIGTRNKANYHLNQQLFRDQYKMTGQQDPRDHQVSPQKVRLYSLGERRTDQEIAPKPNKIRFDKESQ